jgi:SAM-dependent methyltransferase
MSLQSETSLFDAALESARIFNSVAVSCAANSRLPELLQNFSTIEEVAARFGCSPDKVASLEAFLGILKNEGVVETLETRGPALYRMPGSIDRSNLAAGDGAAFHQVRSDVLASWFAEPRIKAIRQLNVKFLGANLQYFRSTEKMRSFGGDYLDTWKLNLNNPLYEFGRLVAVRELASCGRRFLDLACGMGIGAERLAQFAPSAEILCVDKSTAMLAEAKRRIYPNAKVQFIHRDLNDGLPPVRSASIDGVLFNGAFHFILDKAARMREMAAAVRPGGLLVIGHCFCTNGFADEAMHHFYFSTLSDRAHVISFSALKTLASENGFKPFKEYHRGSHSYLLAERTHWQPAQEIVR